MAVAFDEPGHDVEFMFLRQFTEVIGRSTGNAFRAIGVSRTDAGVGQGFAEHDQIGVAMRGFFNQRRELSAGIHRSFRAFRTIMDGGEPDFARRRRLRCLERHIAPLDLAFGCP